MDQTIERLQDAVKGLPLILKRLHTMEEVVYLADLLQATLEAGYDDGFNDARKQQDEND